MQSIIESYVDKIETPLIVMHEEKMSVFRGASLDDGEGSAEDSTGFGAALMKKAKGSLPSLDRIYGAMPSAVRRMVSQEDFRSYAEFAGATLGTVLKFSAKRIKDASRLVPGVRISLRGITRLVITLYSRAVDAFSRTFGWEVDFEFDLMSREVDVRMRIKVGDYFEINVSDFKANMDEPSSVGKRISDTINAFVAPEKAFAGQEDSFGKRGGRGDFTF